MLPGSPSTTKNPQQFPHCLPIDSTIRFFHIYKSPENFLTFFWILLTYFLHCKHLIIALLLVLKPHCSSLAILSVPSRTLSINTTIHLVYYTQKADVPLLHSYLSPSPLYSGITHAVFYSRGMARPLQDTLKGLTVQRPLFVRLHDDNAREMVFIKASKQRKEGKQYVENDEGRIATGQEDILKAWREHYSRLLNVEFDWDSRSLGSRQKG